MNILQELWQLTCSLQMFWSQNGHACKNSKKDILRIKIEGAPISGSGSELCLDGFCISNISAIIWHGVNGSWEICIHLFSETLSYMK